MKDTNIITRQLLDFRLGKDKSPELANALLQQFLSLEPLYLIYNTQDGQPLEATVVNSQLPVFLNRETAVARAETAGGEQVVIEAGAGKTRSIISDYSQKGYISTVKLCANSPVTALIKLPGYTTPPVSKHISTESEPAREEPNPRKEAPAALPKPLFAPVANQEWKLVEDVRKCLTSPSAADRRKLDPGQNYENFHTLIRKLIQENGLDIEEMDRALGMQKGMTHNICTDLKSNNSSKEIVRKYLAYFGLEEFILMFKNESSEIARELKNSSQIDIYEITRASNKTEEPFKLTAMKPARLNGALLYELTLESVYRKQKTYVSCPFRLVVGKEYNVGGLTPLGNGPVAAKSAAKGAAKTSALIVASEEDEEEILAKIEREQQKRTSGPQQRQSEQRKDARMSGKQRYMEETPEEKFEKEKNIILEFIIRTQGCNSRDAQQKFEPIGEYPAIVSDFVKWVKTKKPGGYGVRGYNAARLMNQLHYGPYEAYLMLSNLERDPKKTQEILKYRETDPQYQKKEKPSPKEKN